MLDKNVKNLLERIAKYWSPDDDEEKIIDDAQKILEEDRKKEIEKKEDIARRGKELAFSGVNALYGSIISSNWCPMEAFMEEWHNEAKSEIGGEELQTRTADEIEKVERILEQDKLQSWYEMLGQSGANSKKKVRDEIKKIIDGRCDYNDGLPF